VVAVTLALVFVSLTGRLFVWPARVPVSQAHGDAIVVLNGPDPRWQVALRLAREHAAPVLLLSVSSVRWNCPSWHEPGVKLVCFTPVPATTQGEARFAGAEARRHGWRSLIVVSSRPQDTRARLRVGRCFRGNVEVVTADPSALEWPYQVLYEWGALFKALVLQRSC
jgi:hypothetical protein